MFFADAGDPLSRALITEIHTRAPIQMSERLDRVGAFLVGPRRAARHACGSRGPTPNLTGE